MDSPPDTPATRKVAEALDRHGLAGRLRSLDSTARSAVDAAASIGVPVNAIVKTLIFDFLPTGEAAAIPVAVLVSGDRKCRTDALGEAIGRKGITTRPDAARVKEVTGYSIGGVSPAGLPGGLAVVIDAALRRADEVWAAAGHPHVVFGCSFDELVAITGGTVSDSISE